MIKRLIVISIVLCSALLCSQAPEFAQQYRQRLGGAIDELRVVTYDFDKDATSQGLSRSQALQQLSDAQQAFFQSRAISIQNTFKRYQRLSRQQDYFNSVNPALIPIALLSTYDKTLLQGSLKDYQPAVPLTYVSGLWAALGGLFSWLTMAFIGRLFSSKKLKHKRIAEAPHF